MDHIKVGLIRSVEKKRGKFNFVEFSTRYIVKEGRGGYNTYNKRVLSIMM
jgi:hypothetical protein